MKKIKNWARKNKKIILIADGILTAAICALLLVISAPLDVEGLQVANSTYSTAELTWDKTANAAAYRIYRSEDGEGYEYLETTADTSYTDKKLRTGQNYYYKVVARNGLRTNDIDSVEAVEVIPSLEAPHLDVDTTEGEMKLSYTPVDGAIGYEIIRDGEVIGTTEDTEYIDEQAEAMGGEFNYEVRAYRYGCYFCQTNVGPRKNLKGKSLVNGHSYAKTYCCNPFVHAAGGGWDAGSIRVQTLGSPHYSFVMRYTGNGRGVKYVIKDVDDLGNVIEETTEDA